SPHPLDLPDVPYPHEGPVENAQTFERGRTAVLPDSADCDGLGCDEAAAGCARRLRKLLGASDCVKPRIVAELRAGLEMIFDTCGRRRVDEMLDRKQGRVHLIAGLQRVASIDEQRRLIWQHDG